MRILLITGSLNQGGAEYQILLLAKLFQKEGYDVQVLALTNYSYYSEFISRNKIKYLYVENYRCRSRRIIKAVQKIYKANPEFVISYLRLPSLVAILSRILLLFRFKLIISERTSLILPRYDFLYFHLAYFANNIVVNSISKLKYINNRFPSLGNRTMFIPNIISLENFNPDKTKRTTSDFFRITYIGRISPEKNLLNLVKAFRLILNNHGNVKLVLCGDAKDTNYYNEVMNSVKQLNLIQNVNYIGLVSNIQEIYANTDLLCLVSFYEGFSNVLSEGMSCGIPVVASNIMENSHLIEDCINGFLVNPEDYMDIAEGIEKYINLSDQKKMDISNRNTKKAQNMFDPENVYKSYLELIKIK